MAKAQNHSERRKKFIEQLKAKGKFDDYKKRRAELEKARRIRKKDATDKLSVMEKKLLMEEERVKCRQRVRKHRQIMKKNGINNTAAAIVNRNGNMNRKPISKTTFDFTHSYKTTSAMRKAFTKANKSLPQSPSKRKVIVTKLVRSFDEKDRQDMFDYNRPVVKERQSKLTLSLIGDIASFYERDDVSRISPNVKDVKSIRNPSTGVKEPRQLRHLLLTLEDVYAKFVEEYKRDNDCDPPIKRSKFCELRPEHVLLIGETPRNVCFCIYHSNYSQCCTAVNKYVPQLPKDYNEMVKLLVCENATKDCYFKKCKKCSMDLIAVKLKSVSDYSTKQDKTVMWLEWLKDKAANRFQNETRNGTLQQLMDHLIDSSAQFLKHSFIMHSQAESFNKDQKRVDSEEHSDEATLNIDFPENFKCESQDEIQQANYNQKQISLFVAVLRHAKSLLSTAIASDNTQHTKETIVAYLYKIFLRIPRTVKVVKIWSDGPSSQFKNKYMAAVISLLERKFKFKVIWNFFATAHGKACVDGLGASIKKKVRSMILSKEKIVYRTSEFVDAFNSKSSKIDLFGMSDEEIDKINAELKLDGVFASAPNVRGISEFHQLQVVDNRTKGFVVSAEGYKY